MPVGSEEFDVKLLDMVLCLTRALEFLHPSIAEHHLRTAYIAARVAEELALGIGAVHDVLIAGALHDLAAVCSPNWSRLLNAALARTLAQHPLKPDELHRHGDDGYLMLRDFPPFSRAAHAIRFHHVDWDFGRGEQFGGEPTPLAGHILRLADHAAIQSEDNTNILEQAATIRSAIEAGSASLFQPDVALAFARVSSSESFWLDLANRHKEGILKRRFGLAEVALDLEGLHRLARIFGRIIDYRSSFTASHSSGVAATSQLLAARLGLPTTQTKLIGVAGHLHDIGKLAVPPSILDKPGKLSHSEMLIIKQHPYYTHQILSMVPGLETVSTWAALHHERLDGTGYPFRTRDIPLGARIVAVADVITAITEDRPYRPGMSQAQCLAVLDKMALERAIDGDIVASVRGDFDELHQACGKWQLAHASTIH